MARVWIESQQCWTEDPAVIADEKAKIAADPNASEKKASKKKAAKKKK